MLSFGENYINFSGIGLFDANSPWIHPARVEETYEIIYVISGTVYIKEDEEEFILKKGDLIILKPKINHIGFKESFGKTSFYWLHFFTNNIHFFTQGKYLFSGIKQDYLFKEILHHSHKKNTSPIMSELLLSQLLLSNASDIGEEKSKKLVKDIFEWTKINGSPNLKVTDIAKHFDYSEDHLSRLMKKEYGKNLKQIINDFILEKAKGLLVNTNFSVKEISAALEFDDMNSFFKFFKYHTGKSPSQYRNSYYVTHMNNK